VIIKCVTDGRDALINVTSGIEYMRHYNYERMVKMTIGGKEVLLEPAESVKLATMLCRHADRMNEGIGSEGEK
jgi:hypothetical protein